LWIGGRHRRGHAGFQEAPCSALAGLHLDAALDHAHGGACSLHGDDEFGAFHKGGEIRRPNAEVRRGLLFDLEERAPEIFDHLDDARCAFRFWKTKLRPRRDDDELAATHQDRPAVRAGQDQFAGPERRAAHRSLQTARFLQLDDPGDFADAPEGHSGLRQLADEEAERNENHDDEAHVGKVLPGALRLKTVRRRGGISGNGFRHLIADGNHPVNHWPLPPPRRCPAPGKEISTSLRYPMANGRTSVGGRGGTWASAAGTGARSPSRASAAAGCFSPPFLPRILPAWTTSRRASMRTLQSRS
jgi:hypothetical protein